MALLFMGMVQVASAHPGPPGHSHDDEWPFGEIIVAAVCLGLLLLWFRKTLAVK